MPCPSPHAWLSTRAFKNSVATRNPDSPRNTGRNMPGPADIKCTPATDFKA